MKKLLGFTVSVMLLLGLSSTGYAYSSYLTSFLSTYPGTSGSALNSCVLCHVNPAGGGTRNSYGNAYANVGHNYKTIEPLDSDGDGYTNITEINARTFPGNASSHPSSGGGSTTCTSFTYSAWGTCTNGTQTRTVISSSPSGCTGGNPVLTQSCTTSGGGGGTTTSGITGVVKDIVTGAAISGATISDGTRTATSSSTGAYTLNEAAGNYTLSITKSGYLTTSQRAAVVSGAKANVNWALTKSYGSQAIPARNMSYVIFAWNDLGMHCDQDDYSHFAVLPPYNTLHAQVFRRGSEGASNITSGITVSYVFPKKKNSALHTNFWQYAPQFGWNVPVNVGITGTPLSGNMKLDTARKSWVAEGIPITPYDDDGTWDPYGTATITVKNSSGQVLQTVDVVAPVSTEMMCSNCHGTTNPQLDILQKHDAANGTKLVSDQSKGIVHLCSECHADNALGKTGKAGVESLSLAMHKFHKDKMGASTANLSNGCYNCHPGEKTQCLRGIMARAGKTCTDCHGDMNQITASIQNGRQPWLQEPQCGACHDSAHAENTNTLYRNSLLNNSVDGDMNNMIYCEACHNGPHAELVTANPADPTVSKKFQGDNYWIWNCTVCHNATQQAMHRGSATRTSGTTSGSTSTSTNTSTSSSTRSRTNDD